MGSDINTKKNKDSVPPEKRWFRIGPAKPDLPEFEHIFDVYWGGPERRITGLTLRIIAVNAIALIILIVGILYLSQYQNNLIEAKLETFKTRVDLVSAALVQTENGTSQEMIRALNRVMPYERIVLFNAEGEIITDTNNIAPTPNLYMDKRTFQSIQILKSFASLALSLFPENNTLPSYPKITGDHAQNYPDAQDAMQGKNSFSVWYDSDNDIFLSASAPLISQNKLLGAVLLTRKAKDIEKELSQVWLSILKIFVLTSIVTIILSIYLSGVIAKPLKKLANAAEGVRKGKLSYDSIPDMGERYDEIGELSIALRQMTTALGERMDSTERFAADVAHELKNPLTSLRSAIETLSIVKKKADREKLMTIIMHDLHRLDRLITDISEASRLDAALSREALVPVDIKILLDHLLDMHKGPLARENDEKNRSVEINDVTVSLSFSERGAFDVLGLDVRLGQVFQNLLTNALSFSTQGQAVHIDVTKVKKTVVITFEDQGPGIPENKLETIFERFYSERPASEDYGRHSGLGLSIAKQIIEAFGGEIYAQNIEQPNSEHEKSANQITGARFTVILNAV